MLRSLLQSVWTARRKPAPAPAQDPVELLELAGRCHRDGDPAAAEDHYRRYLGLRAHDEAAWNRLGNLLLEQNRVDEALHCFDASVSLQPQTFHAHVGAAQCHMRRRRWELAAAHFESALQLDPGYAASILGNLGFIRHKQVRIQESIEAHESSLAMDPDNPDVRTNFGLVLYEAGRIAEAEAQYLRALKLRPESHQAHSNLLCLYAFTLHEQKERVYKEHRAWAQRHADALTRRAPPHPNDPDPDRPLRVGYVSADFREHSVSFFIEPVFARHDRSAFHVTCYDNWEDEDGYTRRLQGEVQAWRKIAGMDDDAVARLIREDRIDILVDLSGHTAGHRLLVFARKPAPVQATWFGYMCTTGLLGMDYRITDANLDPPGQTEQYYSEQLLRIDCCVAFSPSPLSPPVGPPPALSRGTVTFGSFNNYTKIGDEVIALWSRILLAVPGSRLRLVALGGDEPDFQRRAQERFARFRLPAERLEIVGRRPLKTFLEMFREVDIALDPFPYSGGTTSLHTLWMGVPIVALEGELELSRSTSGMLRGARLDELVARGAEEYFAVATALARDAGRMASLRAGMRASVAASGILNSEAVTRSLERGYREMWRRWCVGKSRAAAEGAA